MNDKMRIKLLAKIARKMLHSYYKAQETVIWEYSGNIDEDLKELDLTFERMLNRIDYLEKQQ